MCIRDSHLVLGYERTNRATTPIGTILDKITAALQALRYCCIQVPRAFHIGKWSKGGTPPRFYAPLCDNSDTCDNSDPCAEIEFNHSVLVF